MAESRWKCTSVYNRNTSAVGWLGLIHHQTHNISSCQCPVQLLLSRSQTTTKVQSGLTYSEAEELQLAIYQTVVICAPS